VKYWNKSLFISGVILLIAGYLFGVYKYIFAIFPFFCFVCTLLGFSLVILSFLDAQIMGDFQKEVDKKAQNLHMQNTSVEEYEEFLKQFPLPREKNETLSKITI